MKATVKKALLKAEDEFSVLYNWSERTAVTIRTKNQRRVSFADSMIDLLCMAATSVAMVNCL